MAKYNRGERLPGVVRSANEIRALMGATNRGMTGARNRALIALLWRAGLRTAEALALVPSDLDPRTGLVCVLGKGGKPREVGLPPDAFAVVDAWLAYRSTLPGLGKDVPLLCSLRGKPLSSGYCRAMLKRAARHAGVTGRVHLHGLRHSHAVGLIRAGVDLPRVQAQMGHSALSVTGRYLAHVTPADLAEMARALPTEISNA